MTQFITLFVKEMREAARSFKLLWMPLVFISLGISDPLVNYYMDDIMASVGNLPDGFEMIMPELTAADILLASTGQFQMIGLAVVVGIFASSISRERQNGTAAFLYARPLSFSAYFLSKFVAAVVVVLLCVVCGYAASMYYTAILYDLVPIGDAVLMIGTYMLWMLFVIAFTLCMSALFKTAVAMFASVIVLVIGVFIDSLIGGFWTVSPFKLSGYAVDFVLLGEANEHFAVTAVVTLVLTVIFVVLGIVMSKVNRKKLVL